MIMNRNILLYPVSVIYGLITGLRNYLYNSGVLHVTSFPVPVICVGNITVGGTGKTPHTEYLAKLLKSSFSVAVLSRGYKRSTTGFRLAGWSSSPADIGDEPSQISRKFPGITVAVDSDRVNGINKILEYAPGTNVIILDDGFQHRRVKPGLSILLTDFSRPFYRDHMLPFGNLREWKSNSVRADVIVVTKCPGELKPFDRRLIRKEMDKAPFQSLFFSTLSYGTPLKVFPVEGKESVKLDPRKCSGCGAVLLTGIANPMPLRRYLEKFFGEIARLEFSDHHSFTARDLITIREAYGSLKSPEKYIITTEKDAVRLTEMEIDEYLRPVIYYVPIEVSFLDDDKMKFDKIITGYVGKNCRHN
jgi:tetraacyldisaccharide 4'-kinase